MIVGGGIQGVTMALAARGKGLRPILVERRSVGSGATGNSYGIIHGGLRYLQTLDVPRWRRSRRAQCWFLENYPQHVRPLRCIMPLYKGCFRSRLAFQTAGAMENALFRLLGGEPPLPRLRLMSAEELTAIYPVPVKQLDGAAVWYDVQIDDIEAMMTAMLNDAGLEAGSRLLEAEAIAVELNGDAVSGVRIRHSGSGAESVIKSQTVVNCSGSWANQWNRFSTGPTTSALAFNLLLDMPFPGEAALAVSEHPGRGRSFFLRPYQGKTFAGTWYRAAPSMHEPEPYDADIQDFLDALECAMPGMNISQAPVMKVMPGLLPDTDGTGNRLSSRDTAVIGRPRGFHTVVGGKLTTAPLLSFDVANRIWPQPIAQKAAA